MNKYLAKRKELEEKLAKEFNVPTYEIMRKLELASELDFILENEEYEKYNLTDEQQEEIIQIAYDFDMNLDESESAYKIVKAVTRTLLEYESCCDFIGKYETDYSTTFDSMVWNLG